MEVFKRGWFSGRSSYNTATTSVAMLPSTTDLEALGGARQIFEIYHHTLTDRRSQKSSTRPLR